MVFFSVQAALTDLSIPSVEVEAGEDENALPELEVSDDPASATKLDTSKVPILLTVSQVCSCKTAPASWLSQIHNACASACTLLCFADSVACGSKDCIIHARHSDAAC